MANEETALGRWTWAWRQIFWLVIDVAHVRFRTGDAVNIRFVAILSDHQAPINKKIKIYG
jgi:hypothetical protein